MRLAFGYSDGVPEGITTAWGARLIGPNDLLHDRQDLVAANDEAKSALVRWLNGGAIRGMRDELAARYNRPGELEISSRENREHVLFNDEHGMIVGNTNASGGHVYVAGWLKGST